jgi:hypothetical protein
LKNLKNFNFAGSTAYFGVRQARNRAGYGKSGRVARGEMRAGAYAGGYVIKKKREKD